MDFLDKVMLRSMFLYAHIKLTVPTEKNSWIFFIVTVVLLRTLDIVQLGRLQFDLQ